MPRFAVAFGRRKSAADNLEHAPLEPSFRVLDRSEVHAKAFDGGARLAAKTHHLPTTSVDMDAEDNIFADLKTNRCVVFLSLCPLCLLASAALGHYFFPPLDRVSVPQSCVCFSIFHDATPATNLISKMLGRVLI
jgi:hypothetical protein